MKIALRIINKVYSRIQKVKSFSMGNSYILSLILFLFFFACNQKNLWENEYLDGVFALSDVTILSTSAGIDYITLNWIDPAVDFDTIEITCTDGGTSNTYTELPGIQTYTITGLAEGTGYNVSIRVTDTLGNASPGINISVTTGLLPDVAITDVIANNALQQITLQWSEPAGDYDQIHVLYSGAASGDTYLASTGTGTGTYTLTSAVIGSVYTFIIRTVSGANESTGVVQNGACGIFFVSTTGVGTNGGGWFNYAKYSEPQKAIEDARGYSFSNGDIPVDVWIMAGRYIPSNDSILGWPNGGSLPYERHFCMRPYVQIYGGFAGTETAPAGRAKSDRDGNGTVEAWEFTNETTFDGDLDNDDAFNTEPDGSGSAATINTGYRISANVNAQCVINNIAINLNNSAVLKRVS
jgi:hypothetical protein